MSYWTLLIMMLLFFRINPNLQEPYSSGEKLDRVINNFCIVFFLFRLKGPHSPSYLTKNKMYTCIKEVQKLILVWVQIFFHEKSGCSVLGKYTSRWKNRGKTISLTTSSPWCWSPARVGGVMPPGRCCNYTVKQEVGEVSLRSGASMAAWTWRRPCSGVLIFVCVGFFW